MHPDLFIIQQWLFLIQTHWNKDGAIPYLHISVFTTLVRAALMHLSHVNTSTDSSYLCISSPLSFLDGVDLTGATSFTTSGSKDKLLNTHAEVTYVFHRLPDSLSSTSPLNPPPQPAWASCFPCFQSVLIFSICLCEYNESQLVHKSTVTCHRLIELAPVKCTKLHCSSETEPNLAGSPGAYTLNRGIDCFNPVRLLGVRDNNLLSYSEITFALRSCAIV